MQPLCLIYSQVEDFNEQPNAICPDCWKKTEEFDKFYKSVQAAHLNLLSTKYKNTDVQETIDIDLVKGESVDAIKCSSKILHHSEDCLASKYEEDYLKHGTHVDQENGTTIALMKMHILVIVI